LQNFIRLSKVDANKILKLSKMSKHSWDDVMLTLSGGSITTLVIPSIHWSLNVVLVTQEIYMALVNGKECNRQYEAKHNGTRMLFCYEQKQVLQSRGISVSTWILGDPQVSRTRVSYEYIKQYQGTFGSGYGSRPRSSCLNSVNSYRGQRFNQRVHPTPFIYDGDIGNHQYFSSRKQQSCLMQMKLESILHNLTNDASFVAERENPLMVRVTSGMATKLIATTGQSLFAFWNGLHVDECDWINDKLKKLLFPSPTEDFQKRVLEFNDFSFPTTCGYQYVWRNEKLCSNFKVRQHFIMLGLGLGVLLDDSICHHFMGGSFSHCTGLCILESVTKDLIYCNNADDLFHLFAWGNSVNGRTAQGNLRQLNALANHRKSHLQNRSKGGSPLTNHGSEVISKEREDDASDLEKDSVRDEHRDGEKSMNELEEVDRSSKRARLKES
jgi:hypothetical protein